MKRSYFFVVIFVALLGCGNSINNNEVSATQTRATVGKEMSDEGIESTSAEPIDETIINSILESIPSPLEISILIQQTDAKYNPADLNDHSSVTRYATSFKKALNLGIYSTDLGYANIFEQNQDALNFLNSVKKLADGISIGQFFDYSTIKKLVESADDLSHLVQTTTVNFEKINYHLREQKRESLSILILTGGWIEITYLTSLVYERNKNENLKETLADQKIILERLLLVLDVYQDKLEFKELTLKLKALRKIYDKVKIQTIIKPPKSVETADGVRFEDQNEVIYNITDEDIAEIKSQVNSIRDFIIK